MRTILTLAAVLAASAVSQAGEIQKVRYETQSRTVCVNGVCRVVTETVPVVYVESTSATASESCPCVAAKGSCSCNAGALLAASDSGAKAFPRISAVVSRFAEWRANRPRLFGGRCG